MKYPTTRHLKTLEVYLLRPKFSIRKDPGSLAKAKKDREWTSFNQIIIRLCSP